MNSLLTRGAVLEIAETIRAAHSACRESNSGQCLQAKSLLDHDLEQRSRTAILARYLKIATVYGTGSDEWANCFPEVVLALKEAAL